MGVDTLTKHCHSYLPSAMDNAASEQVPPSDNSVAHVPSSQLSQEVKSEVAVQAFRSQRDSLLDLMRHCLSSLANSLLARDIIPKDVFEDVCNQMVNKSQRCANLLECMEDTIKIFPSKFLEIIRVLESEPFLKSMASELVQSYCINSSSESVDGCPSPVSSAISHYRAYLKAVYSNSFVSKDSKWPPTPSRKYIKLAVVEGRHKVREDYIGHTLQGNIKQVLLKRKEISLNEILPINLPKLNSSISNVLLDQKVNTYERLILIEGAPGIGKSTLAWELCRKWEEFSSMQQYSLVVLLRLREAEVQKIRCVNDLFYSYESKDKKSLEDEILKRQGKDVLFILDGFDELPSDLQSKGYLLDLIRGSVLPESTMLVTSRPSATAELLTCCQPDKHIEILGFTQESVEAYASSVFKSQPDQLERFNTFISAASDPAINSLMYVPLNAAIIVQIFCDTESDGFLPHTLTQLYTKLCITIVNRHLKAKCHSVVDRFKDLPTKLHEQFLELSKLAFEGIKKKVVIFHTLPSGFEDFGFFNAVSALYGGGGVSCNFLHLTLQKFLAAYYISSDGLDVFSDPQYDEIQWNVVLRFLAGITGHCENILQKHYNPKDGIVAPFFIQCLFEAKGQRKQCAPPYHLPHPVTFQLTNSSSALDMYALGYCIANSLSAEMISVKLANFAENVNFQPFLYGLKSHAPCVCNFKKLHIVRCLYVFPYLRETLINLTSLCFAECNFSDENLVKLSKLIPRMRCLSELMLSSTVFFLDKMFPHFASQRKCYEGCLKVLHSLSLTNVTTLNIMNSGICYNNCILGSDSQLLASAMEQLIDPSNGKLKKLYIGDIGKNNPYPHHECNVLKILSANSSLQSLHLNDPCQSSLNLFAQNTCLTELDIYCKELFPFSIEKILATNKTVTHMFLASIRRVEDFEIIAQGIEQNATIQCFKLEFDYGRCSSSSTHNRSSGCQLIFEG